MNLVTGGLGAGSGGSGTPEEIAAAVWAALLPGAYTAGQAGYILGHLPDQISEIIGGPSQTVVIGPGECADVQRFDAGEEKPVTVRLTATNGTFTISSATVTLQDASGDALYGIEDEAVTGFDAGALVSPRAWYLLSTIAPPTDGPIAVGVYNLVFTIVGTTSEGISRTQVLEVTIPVE